jgi:pSer/pThr/pTyr-binding forkhead associated (FHA) protein
MKIGALETVVDGKVCDVVLLLQEVTVVGREQGDLVVDDDEASAQHCQIQRLGDCYHLTDLGSSNGTFVNKQQVTKVRLTPGDEVRIGQTMLRFTEQTLVAEPNVHELASSLVRAFPRPSGEAAELLEALDRVRQEVLPRCHLVLDVVYGDGTRQILRFEEGKVELGRQMDRGRFGSDDELSKIHATVRVGEGGQIFVYDQMSTNGTFINEVRVLGERLMIPGDTLRIGQTRIWCRPEPDGAEGA